MKIKSIKNLKDLENKRILLRVDYNVPIEDGRVMDDYKIVKQLLTLRFLLKKNCRIVLITHLGQPEPEERQEKFLLGPVCARLSHLLGKKVEYVDDLTGFKASNAVAKMQSGDVLLLDNVRFDKGELDNSRVFAKKLAKYGDIYINDAFAVSHRAQASVSAITKYLPSFAGLLLEDEVLNLVKGLESSGPRVAIIGGAKLTTKIPLIKKLNKEVDHILVGGALANDFFVAHNLEVGKSLIDNEGVYFVRKFTSKKIVLPVDVVVSTDKEGGKSAVKSINKVDKNDYILDIGPETIKLYANYIKQANTLIWNGPMGFFELKDYRHGTLAIALLIAARSKGRAFGVVGGGETVEALKMSKMLEYVDWVSTGGGAMLSFLGGEKMPGLDGILV